MRAIYSADTGTTPVTVNANSTKTVFGVEADAGHAIDLLQLKYSVDQATATASDKQILVLIQTATFATNAPGTNSTAATVDQVAGPRVAETFAAAINWTTEPTVLVPVDAIRVDPYKFTYENSAVELDFGVADGFAITIVNPTSNQNVNVDVTARWARV